MRSRYTAFVRLDAAYLLATWHPSTRPARLDLDRARRWTGLEVLATSGGLLADEGTVSFRAHYRDGREEGVQAEHSAFRRVAGRWAYTGPVSP
jgi:SEC-C motif-containing protein